MAKKKNEPSKWQSKIVGHGKVAASQLLANPFNHRRHPEKQRQVVAASIEELGFIKSVIVNQLTGHIVDGHERVMQALGVGEETLVDVEYVELSPEDEKKALLLLDASSELATVDASDLDALVSDCAFDTDVLNDFAKEMLESLGVGPEPEIHEDDVPEAPVDPITKLGDLWILGDHRLLCGDSTKAEDVDRLMNGCKPFVMVTDPPYGVKLDQSWRDKALGDKAMGPGNRNIVVNDDRADWTEVWQRFPGDIVYVWHAGKFSDVVMQSLRDAGFEICQQIIWNKSVMVMGRSDYHFKHEPCWYAVRKNRPHGWTGDRKQTTVIDAKSPNHIMSGSDEEKTDHPTQKPVECMAYLMKNHEGSVYDPFLGSGTTLIAAEQLGRKCYGMEISPRYCDVIVKRWENLTGRQAVLEEVAQ